MSITSVVVGVDGSAEAEQALIWALHEGRLRGLPVRAVNVWHPNGTAQQTERLAALTSVTGLRERLGRDVAAGVRAVVEGAGATDVAVTTDVRHGHPAQGLIREAGVDSLLVVGSRGRGSLAGSVLGSVSQTCAQYAQTPVVVVRGDRPDSATKRVVAGVDGSPHSVRALRFAHDAAAHRGAELQAVHTWTVPYMGFAGPMAWPQDALDEIEAQSATTLRDSVRRAALDATRAQLKAYLVQGPPAASLLELAEGADLLVVGSRGYGGWKGLLMGSVSTHCVTHAPCPIAVIHDDGDADALV
ncbi:universal stress protein [Paractinoplanes rishiriensis]|uniref:universal stress protein n=1 Tax=Paractinoplanes rishiriensis TaxID=1050105 RepID=UPI0019456F60|nr:universal stress protein [Actinoplanes rishiriensis]